MPLSLRSLPRNLSVQEQTYQRLRAAILSGELPPGERLIETHLAKSLEVSRTPIREALKRLEQEDLITMDDNNILRVAKFSVNDAIQLYDCRIALEKLSVSGACQKATGAQLEELEKMVQQAENLSQNKSSELTNFQRLDLDYQFHRLLAESSGNLWLRCLLEQIFNKMILLRIQTTQNNPKVLEIRFEHRRVFDAVAQRDANKAMEMIEDHLLSAKIRVVREMENIQLESQNI